MSINAAITGLFWLAAATAAIGLWRRASLWRQGRAAPVAWSGLLQIPKRYFVDLHHVVAREPYIAHAHVATAGGAVAALALVGVNYGLALYWPALDRLILVAAAIMLMGALLIWMRRRDPPARLSRGAWNRLPYSLAAFALGIGSLILHLEGVLPAAIAVLSILCLAAGFSELALGIGTGGPMKHAVAGLLHLAFHPRPERFAGERATALKPLALDRDDFGIEKPKDFAWNQLLGFDACVQCGKCEDQCPAFASGQPLTPKKLIQDLVAGLASTSDVAYAGRPYPGRSTGGHSGALDAPVVPRLIEAETLWSCTTCRACVEACPMMIEHVDAIIGLRRHRNLVAGEAPGKAAETLANLRETGTQGGCDLRQRYNWGIDLGLEIAEPGKPIDVLLIAGEGAFDMRYQRTLRALVRILKAANVDVAVLGATERDTGDTARRLGDEATFQSLAQTNIETLRTLTFRTIVTPDPHVLHSIGKEYPALGGRFPVLHHAPFLRALVDEGRLKLTRAKGTSTLTYHDPCYLGRYAGEFEAPRALLRAAGYDIREMDRSGPRSRCCGGGGGAPLTDIPGKTRIPDQRMDDARATGAGIVAVACPQCTAMLEGVAGERPEVRDIAEIVADAMEVPAP